MLGVRVRRRHLRLARTVAVLAVFALAVTWAFPAGSPRPQRGAHLATAVADRRVPTAALRTASVTAPRAASPPAAIGTYAVGSSSLGLVEPATAGSPSRPLPTGVWFPSAGQGGSTPLAAGAPYPLLVFSSGFDRSVVTYQALIDAWVSAGFVVVGPTYPHTDPGLGPVERSDLVRHPRDLRYVLDAVLGQASLPGNALSGLVDPAEIGVVGQSDGAMVSLAVAADSCCHDPRVKAAAVMSGSELVAFGGSYFTGPAVPLLVVQGSADHTDPPACSAYIYDDAPAPKYWLDLLGADHFAPYVDPGADRQAIAQVTVDFFAAELEGRSSSLASMASDGTVPGQVSFGSGPRAPWPAGSC